MRASVIIPTRNRAGLLDSCLESLTKQTLSNDQFEVLVIDNGSSDNTADVVARYHGKFNISRHWAPEPGLHIGRHMGMQLAKADILIFADDDIEATPKWIESILDAFVNGKTAIVGGNNFPHFEVQPPAWLELWWDKPINRGRALGYLSILDFGEGCFDIDPGYIWGCNFSIRKEILSSIGGFHPDSVPKEMLRLRGDGESHVSEVIRRRGLRASFHSGASVQHFVPKTRMTKQYFEDRAFAQGISDSYTEIRKNGKSGLPIEIRVQQVVKRMLLEFHQLKRSLFTSGNSVEYELQLIQAAAMRSYWRGYAFHQREAATDPSLIEWILKADYRS